MTKKKKFIVGLVSVIFIGLIIVLAPILMFGGSILGEMLFDRPSKPKVTQAEFPFELVYEYNNEQFTVKETIVCEYEGVSFALEGGNSREWNCYITNNEEYGRYYLDTEKYPNLYVQVPLDADYYMGDPECDPNLALPFIHFIDESTGTNYYENEKVDVVGAKIISWKPTAPLEGNIK